MPYVSDAQRKWAHTESAKKAGFPTEKWDKESKGQGDLPEHAKKKAHFAKHLKKAHKAWAESEDNPHNSIRM